MLRDLDDLAMIGGRPLWYNMAGEPISTREAEKLLVSQDARRVGYSVAGPYNVSTVLLVNDYAFGQGKPIIYETMIFGPDDYPFSEQMQRYSTKAEADIGHRLIVQMCWIEALSRPALMPPSCC